MPRPILNVSEVELQPRPPALQPKGAAGERYDARMGFVGQKLGARKLGYSITAVAPGKRAFPKHNHRVNEEMFYIIDGTGEHHVGDQVHPIRAGDIIACPPGGKETAHQIVNTGTTELRYLGVSTRLSPDIAEYPNSGKFGILAELDGGPDGKPDRFSFLGRLDRQEDYWEGE